MGRFATWDSGCQALYCAGMLLFIAAPLQEGRAPDTSPAVAQRLCFCHTAARQRRLCDAGASGWCAGSIGSARCRGGCSSLTAGTTAAAAARLPGAWPAAAAPPPDCFWRGQPAGKCRPRRWRRQRCITATQRSVVAAVPSGCAGAGFQAQCHPGVWTGGGLGQVAATKCACRDGEPSGDVGQRRWAEASAEAQPSCTLLAGQAGCRRAFANSGAHPAARQRYDQPCNSSRRQPAPGGRWQLCGTVGTRSRHRSSWRSRRGALCSTTCPSTQPVHRGGR